VEKGLFLFVRLAEELGKRHPKIAVLAIESRGTAGMVCAAGLAGGFDLRRHESVMIAPPVPRPRDLYTHMRILVAPSVWEEPAGRVAAEAVINGVVPLYSDRGTGLAECANGAGFPIHLPEDLTLKTRTPVSAEAVKPWIDLIERLCFDEPFYQAEVARARVAAEMYKRENLRPKYVDFFQQTLARPMKK
jgi:glycosyltransferase involved in cell wall biosynthesis